MLIGAFGACNQAAATVAPSVAVVVVLPTAAPTTPPSPTPAPTATLIDGMWEVTTTHDEMLAAGIVDQGEDNPGNFGHFTLSLHTGSYELTQSDGAHAHDVGSYILKGNTFLPTSGIGEEFACPFTVTATMLTFGEGVPVWWRTKAWTRIGS
jgi:hypothetical protein